MKVKSESEVAQSCPTLRDPMDCSPPGSSVHGFFQARILEWGAVSFSRDDGVTYWHITSLEKGDRETLLVPLFLALWNFTAAAAAAKSLQLCPTLCDPIDGSPPGSPVPGILQARTLEWVAIAFSNAGK